MILIERLQGSLSAVKRMIQALTIAISFKFVFITSRMRLNNRDEFSEIKK